MSDPTRREIAKGLRLLAGLYEMTDLAPKVYYGVTFYGADAGPQLDEFAEQLLAAGLEITDEIRDPAYDRDLRQRRVATQLAGITFFGCRYLDDDVEAEA
jgi:hypothetical protein